MTKHAKPADPDQAPAKVDLNAATVDQLQAIKGIGKSRALEIVRYRDKNGPFMSLDELGRVPHMGDMPWGELDRVKTRFTVRIPGDAASPTAPGQVKVDVNAANIEELRAVEGIEFDRAQEILQYREQHGRILELSELDSLPHFRDEPEGQRAPIKARLRV
jgi:competence protein ComEA